MILNISGRTDIVNHYSDWLFRRFEEGYVFSRNSLFPNSVRRYELTSDKIDCLIFGSKNYAPVLQRIHEITERFHTYFYYTITAYGRDVEPGVPDIDTSIATLLKLSEIVGARRVAWRYDPVLLTSDYTVARHLETFDYIADRLAGHIDRCIFSFVEMYKKHEINFPELIALRDEDKDKIARGLGAIAAKYGIHLQTCGPEENYAQYGIETSGCVTLDILGRANDIQFRELKHRGFREGCHCMESRDIGALNSCPNGCKYCYANKNAQLPRENYLLHDPESPLLIGQLKPSDNLQQGLQKSFLKQGHQA
ncbi:DUF1848 domain-containing protein [Desulfitobacterium chlororespirans]|uniref:DUF1848 domain-containing protein n=1 Tax=Desulfitobacterium chlororespirans DSM 11544 TaxID=1121395 RepID=A0A1M7TYM3_9FIRM|nr:DUF1848 domain-containing protein [Desulfitobacterium chlororespirans]SHN75808.1 protein of unknown function [Desulfitobacterium chlororespirans DSM 11544]